MLTEWLRQKINNAIDNISNAFITIDEEHHEIHDENSYFFNYSAQLNSAGTIEVRIQTPNTTDRAHYVVTLKSSLYAIAKVWEATTKTHAAGNAITPLNRDRNSSNTSTLTACHTPGGAQAGNPTWQELIGASTNGGQADSGGLSGGRHEIILKQNTAYLFYMISGANSNSCTIICDGYEI